MDPVIRSTTLPSTQDPSKDSCFISHGDQYISIISLTLIKSLRVLRIILVVLPEHPSDTKVLTMKMEILLEPTSNKLLVVSDDDEVNPSTNVEEVLSSDVVYFETLRFEND
ncbi:hypothetical protein Tco_1246778 [Tanacetum coccineum]